MKLKLNLPCKECKKAIYLGELVLIKEGAFHIDCFKKKIQRETVSEILKIIKSRENRQPIGTVVRIYRYCNNLTNKIQN